jgi:AraC-like DNA-binding protein
VVHLDQGGQDAKAARILRPPPDLGMLVETSFVLPGSAEAKGAAAWRVVPDTSPNIVIVVPSNGAAPKGVIVGARTTYADIDATGRRLTLGIRLRPGALLAIARERASVFTDDGVALDDVLGSTVRGVVESAAERAPEQVIAELLAILGRIPRRGCSALLECAARSSSVAELAGMLGVSVRTLNDRAHETIGLSPKRLLRVQRLHRVLEGDFRGLADAAASSGFADQPHLTREFRDLLGETPRQWFGRGRRSVQDRPPVAA